MIFKSNPLPRRLITDDRVQKIREVSKNTWNIRNNSHEVNSLLCGEFKPEITSKCIRNYFSSHCEGCYCRTGRISPAHLSLADETVDVDRTSKTYKDWKKSRRVVENNNDLQLATNFNNNCNLHKFTNNDFDGEEIDSLDGGKFKSKFLERHQNNQNHNNDDLLEFTKQRKTYENHRQNNNANNIGNQGYNDTNNNNKELNLSNLELNQVSNFRDQHYFETHKNTVIETTVDHKCVHKFVVNDRLIPEPVNADPFGRSMCSECSKTMPNKRYERQRVSAVSPVSTAVNTTETGCQNDAGTMTDCRKFALRAQRLNIGCGDELIELKVPAYLLVNNGAGDACRKGLEKRKKVTCCNSMALRFQKCK